MTQPPQAGAQAVVPNGSQAKLKQAVCAAVGLGWQMAELYRERRLAEEIKEAKDSAKGAATGVGAATPVPVPAAGGALAGKLAEKDLPGVGGLIGSEKTRLRIDQIAHGLGRLAEVTADEELAALRDEVRDREDLEEEPASKDLRALHVRLLSALTVANYRAGKAYSLGRALCEATRRGQSDWELDDHLGDSHLAKLISWCHDLKSVLPDHAGAAVAGSLSRWQSWGRQKPWKTVDRRVGEESPDGNDEQPVERDDFDRRLSRQGERWRAILTAEKDARDLLKPETYLQAGEALLADAARVGRDFAKKFWLTLVVAAALLCIGIVVMLMGHSENVIAGLGSIAASLGITWKTATPTLSKLAGTLSEPLWGAELDAAITVAVTDPTVPASSATPPSVGLPVPVDRATDPRTTRKTARQVWKRLDRGTRRRALAGRTPPRRLYYRYSGLWLGGSRAAYMPHDVYLSHVQSALENRLAGKRMETNARTRDELFSEFGPDDWQWITTIVQAGLTMLGGRHGFGVKPDRHKMDERVRIVLVGDWGTGTPRARALAQRIRESLGEVECERHLIHLGDVYYCGLPDEYRRRFLGDWPVPDGPVPDGPVPDWPNVHSWNLNGNHDMYSGGNGYFDLIEKPPKLGAAPGKFSHQNGTSFFRLRNKRWQVVGLDSAYVDNDLAPKQLPMLNAWLGLRGVDPELSTARSRRKTLLLSHHQLGSARAQRSVGPGIFDKTAEARVRGRIDAWFWGHEHRCFVYKDYQGVACPVCVGNGGVPELLSHRFTLTGAFQTLMSLVADVAALLHPRRWLVPAPRVQWKPELVYEDPRGLKWEKLGFVVIDLDADREKARYIDEDGVEQPIESFGSEPSGRVIRTKARITFNNFRIAFNKLRLAVLRRPR